MIRTFGSASRTVDARLRRSRRRCKPPASRIPPQIEPESPDVFRLADRQLHDAIAANPERELSRVYHGVADGRHVRTYWDSIQVEDLTARTRTPAPRRCASSSSSRPECFARLGTRLVAGRELERAGHLRTTIAQSFSCRRTWRASYGTSRPPRSGRGFSGTARRVGARSWGSSRTRYDNGLPGAAGVDHVLARL